MYPVEADIQQPCCSSAMLTPADMATEGLAAWPALAVLGQTALQSYGAVCMLAYTFALLALTGLDWGVWRQRMLERN
jgi:hypothetical protein